MGLAIDTSALVAWERATAAGHPIRLAKTEPVVLPAIVWAEALIAVRLADSPKRAAARQQWLDGLRSFIDTFPFTDEVAAHYADIHAELQRKGALIRQNDICVAATARALGFGVLVGPDDETHFSRVPRLKVRVLSY